MIGAAPLGSSLTSVERAWLAGQVQPRLVARYMRALAYAIPDEEEPRVKLAEATLTVVVQVLDGLTPSMSEAARAAWKVLRTEIVLPPSEQTSPPDAGRP